MIYLLAFLGLRITDQSPVLAALDQPKQRSLLSFGMTLAALTAVTFVPTFHSN